MCKTTWLQLVGAKPRSRPLHRRFRDMETCKGVRQIICKSRSVACVHLKVKKMHM